MEQKQTHRHREMVTVVAKGVRGSGGLIGRWDQQMLTLYIGWINHRSDCRAQYPVINHHGRGDEKEHIRRYKSNFAVQQIVNI